MQTCNKTKKDGDKSIINFNRKFYNKLNFQWGYLENWW